ncbi:DUF6415 family natural product biosynthesis protein [Streptomyces sp. WM6378]|uniref:DUF6415 family natural product biosynthesis protein n=1 Tax=Streptomyces sp. WM6378 TaxID=1415557 RepID=UPI0006B02558|nr:DUF6415 family natural product biosynthesis protein [Streptomyces sp. WM6378]KOU46858.1 hypothetical protein ADK54_13980 [Streptomyces sp. WM6378]
MGTVTHQKAADSAPTAVPSAGELELIALDCDRALVGFEHQPDPEENARQIVVMLGCGEQLVSVVTRLPESGRDARVAGALQDWAELLDRGPGDGPFANWTYLRALARAVRSFTQFLQARNGPRPLRPDL